MDAEKLGEGIFTSLKAASMNQFLALQKLQNLVISKEKMVPITHNYILAKGALWYEFFS